MISLYGEQTLMNKQGTVLTKIPVCDKTLGLYNNVAGVVKQELPKIM